MSAEALRTQQAGDVSAAAGRQAEPVKKQPTAAQRMKQRRKRNALLRTCIQAVFFVTMPGAFMAAFSGVKSIFLAISDGSALEMGSFVKALLGLGIFTILFGRFFCQFLCPMGAVFALLPQLPFSALQRDEANCIRGCQACKNNCPVDLKLEKDGFRGGECIACEKCAGICPKGNLTRWDRKLLKHEAVPVILKAALLLGLGFWLGLVRTL